jgi:hypothetical protein
MPRPTRRRDLMQGSAGFSLIELSIALAGLLVVSSVMMSFFIGAARVDGVHMSDDIALEQLRDARQRMSRDVREARRFYAIWPLGFTVWIDAGWDEVIDADELISWSVDEEGNLRRSVGEASRIEARGISVSESYFTFDSAMPGSVTSMGMHIVVIVGRPGDGAAAGTRALDTEITLRNVP